MTTVIVLYITAHKTEGPHESHLQSSATSGEEDGRGQSQQVQGARVVLGVTAL